MRIFRNHWDTRRQRYAEILAETWEGVGYGKQRQIQEIDPALYLVLVTLIGNENDHRHWRHGIR